MINNFTNNTVSPVMGIVKIPLIIFVGYVLSKNFIDKEIREYRVLPYFNYIPAILIPEKIKINTCPVLIVWLITYSGHFLLRYRRNI